MFCFCGVGAQTQGCVPDEGALYQLSHILRPSRQFKSLHCSLILPLAVAVRPMIVPCTRLYYDHRGWLTHRCYKVVCDVNAFGWGHSTELIFYVYYFRLCVGLCVGVCTECRCLWRPEKGVWSPDGGITGGCELPHMDAGNQVRVFWKRNTVS